MNPDHLQDLRARCEKLLNKQEEWKPGDLEKDFIVDLMRYCIDTIPRKTDSVKLTAELCEFFGPARSGGMKETYRQVARVTGKTPEAVRKCHDRWRSGRTLIE
jgi:hypothetical protein